MFTLKTQTLALASLLLAAGLAVAPVHAQNSYKSDKLEKADAVRAANVVDIVVGSENHKTLTALVTSAGLVDALKSADAKTIFAPTDEAFAKVPAETLAALQADPEALKNVLTYHVAPGRVGPTALKGAASAEFATLQGSKVALSQSGTTVKVGGATVLGSAMAANGVVHIIDTVLLPPAPAGKSIAQIATEAGTFNTLVAALGAAGLAETLAGEGSFTVFAPTDEAFAKLGDEAIQGLLANPEQLKQVLLYHVVDGTVTADKVVGLTSAKTLQGGSLPVKVADGKVMIGAATVTATDIKASNGVIHVIDTVLVP